MPHLSDLEQRIGHRFGNPALLEQALTHRSFGSPHNERLEFLGDGVLGCVVAADLCERFPEASEGELSRLRASMVREAALAESARAVGLSSFLRLGEGEVASAGAERASTLADALEAVFGAAFLDGGYPAAHAVIHGCLGSALRIVDAASPAKDPKTRLQEYLQGRRRKLPAYRVASTIGAAHKQVFEVECIVEELGLAASGRGRSRRAAEQRAAENLLKLLEA
ncbi:MAG: ribonuclease III [Burkholderiales bacterium]